MGAHAVASSQVATNINGVQSDSPQPLYSAYTVGNRQTKCKFSTQTAAEHQTGFVFVCLYISYLYILTMSLRL